MHELNQLEPVVSVRSVSKIWPGGVEAVRNIDFEVLAGEVFGLLGPNGAGKSTTIGMLTTAVSPSRGVVRIAGVDVAKDPIAARSVSGVVFQDAVVDRALTGRRNLQTHALLWGVPKSEASERVDDVATVFGLTGLLDRRVETYSGGERRRLEIARALLSRPSVLFLDEPTVGLDPRMRYELLDVIAGLRRRRELTVLLTTHYLDEAERLCDRIGIMHEGALVAMGSPSALLAELGDVVIELRTSNEHDADVVLSRLQTHHLADEKALLVGSTVSVPLRGPRVNEITASLARLDLPTISATTRPPHLDDVYLRLTGDRIAA